MTGIQDRAGAAMNIPECGKENYGQGEGYDATMRECFWQAYSNKQPVAFTSTHLTQEGDPIVTKIRVYAVDRIEVTVGET